MSPARSAVVQSLLAAVLSAQHKLQTLCLLGLKMLSFIVRP